MEQFKETIKIPKLTNVENFKDKFVNGKIVNGKIVNGKIVNGKIVNGKIVNGKIVKFNLNKILFILFILFLIFFLYNCKYGIFKIVENGPIPYSLMSLV